MNSSGIWYFDAHADSLSMSSFLKKDIRENDMQVDLLRAKEFSRYAQFFSVFDNGKGSSDISGSYDRILSHIRSQLEKNSDLVIQCRNAREVENAGAASLCAAILSVEGAELLACSEERLESAYKDGVRAVNLTWNHDNALAGSCATGTRRGLTPEGRSFVKKAQELGILVDMSHASAETFWDTAEISSGPIIASHSNSAAVFEHKRGLDDDQFSFIVKCGGFVGINLYQDFIGGPDMSDLVKHIEHFMSLGGEKTVALGGDLDGADRLAGGIKGIQDIHLLYEELLRLGYSEGVVKDIFYNNIMRVVDKVCGI